MHEIATRLYVPNASDLTAGLRDTFGSATMVINGGLECTTKSGKEHPSSKKRMAYYKAFLGFFKLPAEKGLGCAKMQPFSTESSSNYSQSLDKDWSLTDGCKIVPWAT